MKLKINRNLLNNDAYVDFSIIDISNVDMELLSDFGKPKIQVGGTIPLTESTNFKLSSEIRILPDEFVFEKIFKYSVYGADTQAHALAYIEEIKNRVTTKINELEAMSDTFSGVEEVQL
jgi:hypothetical protein